MTCWVLTQGQEKLTDRITSRKTFNIFNRSQSVSQSLVPTFVKRTDSLTKRIITDINHIGMDIVKEFDIIFYINLTSFWPWKSHLWCFEGNCVCWTWSVANHSPSDLYCVNDIWTYFHYFPFTHKLIQWVRLRHDEDVYRSAHREYWTVNYHLNLINLI